MDYVLLDFSGQIATGGYSSRGEQLKWLQGEWWYKADSRGYEALAEVVVSGILKRSGVEPVLKYEPVSILYRDHTLIGCKSRDFLKRDEELITAEHLYRQYTGKSLAQVLDNLADAQERISCLVRFLEEVTGLRDFGAYLAVQLAIDAFFLNGDRGTDDLAVIRDTETGKYRLCPYFNHGRALLADLTGDPGPESSVEECVEAVETALFAGSLTEQLQAAEKMYGRKLTLKCDSWEADRVLRQFRSVYGEKILDRVRGVLKIQREKYSYMLA